MIMMKKERKKVYQKNVISLVSLTEEGTFFLIHPVYILNYVFLWELLDWVVSGFQIGSGTTRFFDLVLLSAFTPALTQSSVCCLRSLVCSLQSVVNVALPPAAGHNLGAVTQTAVWDTSHCSLGYFRLQTPLSPVSCLQSAHFCTAMYFSLYLPTPLL